MMEKTLQNKVVKYLRAVPCTFFYKAADRYTAGIPDIVGCADGYFFAVELKAKAVLPSLLQREVLNKIQHAGGETWVVYPGNYNTWKKEFEKWMKRI